jgi:hypothetical protein
MAHLTNTRVLPEKDVSMDERLNKLRRQLDQKTSEIESLVASEKGRDAIENMDPSDYERLKQDVEELLEEWEETAQEEGPGSIEDTPLNRLIGERFEIEQEIIAARARSEGNELQGGSAAVEEVELDAQED